MSTNTAKGRRDMALQTPTDLGGNASKDIAAALNKLLADTFALYFKTKNFHWHMSGPHFQRLPPPPREARRPDLRHDRPDRGARCASSGQKTLHSIGEVKSLQRILDNDADYVSPQDMLAELRDDNLQFITEMRQVHEVCDEHNDVATASLLEVWIDESERRAWFLFETARTNEG